FQSICFSSAGAWMSEKSLAVLHGESAEADDTVSCHDEIPDAHMSMHLRITNFAMACDKIMSRSKDLEGVHAPA
ncbi:MAG TPA: hypothetical protein VMH06_03535, partial [Thermodesulfovibrionales bacterium]|nr:hypothetical protein [Thermodesulfovibrionales bacterium]